MYVYKRENFETQIIDNDFSILSINSELEYKDCDNNACNIKFFDKKIDENNIKSLYYITHNDDIYLLNSKIGIKKSKIITTDKIIISCISFSNNLQYGFAGTKSDITKDIKIYYTTDYANTWKKLIFKYDGINDFKKNIYNELNDEKYENITFLNKKDIEIDNIDVIYKDNIPISLIFSTIGKIKYNNNDEEYFYTETTLKHIDLKDFEKKEFKNEVYICTYKKFYYDKSNLKENLREISIKKIINDNYNNYFILLNTNKNKEKNILLFLGNNNIEYIFTHYLLYDIKFININKKFNEFDNILLGISSDKKKIIIFNDLYKDIKEGYKRNTFENYNKLIFDNNSINKKGSYDEPEMLNISSHIHPVITDEDKIKYYDYDYIDNSLGQLMLYYVSINNRIFYVPIKIFKSDIDPLEKGEGLQTYYSLDINTTQDLDYPNDIKFINYLLIHPKIQKKDKSSIFIANDKNIFFYNDGNWKELNSYSLEYNKYNTKKLLNDITDTRKIAFNGDNTLKKHKIYNIEFKIDKYVDILMVGGGGGGGYGGGGGGGGDVKLYKNLKMPAGEYRLLIGSGGKGGKDENDDLGKYGNNTEIELINGDETFEKLIVAGGAGGGSYSKNATLTPNSGIIGNKLYSSGGGGGGGTTRGIGGIGNEVSGNGGGTYYNDILYGGGGGGGGNSNLFNDEKKKTNHGKSPDSGKIAHGGKSILLIDKYKYNTVDNVSGGGLGGIYGDINNNNEEMILNKLNIYNNLYSERERNLGKGGDGKIILKNSKNEIINEIIQKNEKLIDGSEGIIIIYGSKEIYKEILDNEKNISARDKLLNLYKLKDRDIANESKVYNKKAENDIIKRTKIKNEFKKNIKKPNNKNNIYELEKESNKLKMEYTEEKDKITIDPISDAYLPYSQTEKSTKIDITDPMYNVNKYKIIKLYKELLYRQPTSTELDNFSRKIMSNFTNLEKIKRHIINTDEYSRVIKLQSNDPNPNLIYSDIKNNLYGKIANIYLIELNEEIPKSLLGPLNDIYHFLQYNEYLLRALLIHSNFDNLKTEIIDNKKLVKNDIIKLLKKHVILSELKDKGNDIQRFDKYNKGDSNNDIIEGNNTDKYKRVEYDDTDELVKTDLKNLILQDNYNYYLWDKKTSDDLNTNEFKEKLDEIQKMRDEIDKTGKETFKNFETIYKRDDILDMTKKNFYIKNESLVNQKTYDKMNRQFTNNF